MKASLHIVDDDEAVRDSLQILMEARGYAVTSHAGGREFLAAFGAEPGACLVLDINMPVMSGLEVLAVVRQRWPQVPVILVTGRSENLARSEALAQGASALLEKPFRDDVLIAAIEEALSGTRLS